MLKPNQKILTHWIGITKNHYIQKGYVYTKYLDEFEVQAEDLTFGSNAKVIVVCDYCGKEITKKYNEYLREHDDKFGDCCKSCKEIKRTNTCMKKYGVPYALQRDNINKKREKTNIKKYGFASPTQNANVLEKSRKTCQKKYGGNSSMSSPEVLKKYRQTCMNKYGVPYASQDPIIKEKTIKTLMKTINENGTVPKSIPETKMCEILLDMYKEKCFPSFLLDKIIMDCMIEIKNIKIDVEYDGVYWHNKNPERDIKRDYFVRSKGYKILRVKGNYEVPSKEELQKAINYLVNNNSNHTEILLDV